MTKYEFLEGLSAALEDLPSGQRQENLRYYEEYIDRQVLSGRSEEDVLNELGDPRWIAMTILDAASGNTRVDETVYDAGSGQRAWDGWNSWSREAGGQGIVGWFRDKVSALFGGHFEWQPWMVFALIIVVLMIFFMILGAIFGFFFRVLFWLVRNPAFWAVMVALWIYYRFFRNNNPK